MYSFEWDKRTGGCRLTTQTTKFVASEIRPVFAEELKLTGLDSRLSFDSRERLPQLWAKQNIYIYRGVEIVKLNKTRYGSPLDAEWLIQGKKSLVPVDVPAMVKKNRGAMAALVSDTLKRIKEMYDAYVNRCDAVYIGFSGGKDSVVLLDLCHKVLPLNVPVIFSDTDMELPDTYRIWDEVQKRYPERQFVKVLANRPALENWRLFGPPSRSVRWCCAVHKSAPALVELKRRSGKAAIVAAAFVGVRGEESLSRANYQDIGEGVKNTSQTNLMPILDWAAHELWIYLFGNELSINPAYRYGLARVGCIMCPESSEKYAWFVNAAYPQIIKPFERVIVDTNAKHFDTEEEAREFVGSTNWQARKSGVALKEHISRPTERADGNTVKWQSHDLRITFFMEWLKTVGTIEQYPGRDQFLLKVAGGNAIPFIVQTHEGCGGSVEFRFTSDAERKFIVPIIIKVLQKAVSCIGCQACEAECPTGALTSTAGRIKVNELLCVHCLRCHSADFGGIGLCESQS
jgi:3'-phosphoadenosine 5'-phosphosulfate sulfotransferase (PAPS reductase)/FAD synthetase/ferredoxin